MHRSAETTKVFDIDGTFNNKDECAKRAIFSNGFAEQDELFCIQTKSNFYTSEGCGRL